MAISVTRPPDATVVGETRIDDRDARREWRQISHRAGRLVGRWGEWATHLGPPKARTAPPAPALELTYRPPALPSGGGVPDGPLSGTLTFRAAIPRTDDLPPGGHPLDRLELSQSTGGGAPAVTTIVLGASGTLIEVHPAPLHDVLLLTRAGPPLERAAPPPSRSPRAGSIRPGSSRCRARRRSGRSSIRARPRFLSSRPRSNIAPGPTRRGSRGSNWSGPQSPVRATASSPAASRPCSARCATPAGPRSPTPSPRPPPARRARPRSRRSARFSHGTRSRASPPTRSSRRAPRPASSTASRARSTCSPPIAC